MQYYLAINGQQAGPFEEQDLVANGMTADTMVWTQGMAQWLPAGQVPELAIYLQQSATGGAGVNYAAPQYYGNDYLANGAQPQQHQPYSYAPPENYLTKAILVTIFCFFPVGIPAIIHAALANGHYRNGNQAEAERCNRLAKKFIKIAFWIGIGYLILVLIYVIFVVSFAASYHIF